MTSLRVNDLIAFKDVVKKCVGAMWQVFIYDFIAVELTAASSLHPVTDLQL
jgi:hypothetical protein